MTWETTPLWENRPGSLTRPQSKNLCLGAKVPAIWIRIEVFSVGCAGKGNLCTSRN